MARPHHHPDADLPLFGWKPRPVVLPFPSKHRADLIARNARRMAELREDKAIAHLDRTVAAMAARLARLGVDPGVIDGDMAEVRIAILDRYRFVRALDVVRALEGGTE